MTMAAPASTAGSGQSLQINQPNLDTWLGALERHSVTLALPRFTVHSKVDLVPPLQAMGIEDAFLPGVADLSGMSADADLYVTGVFHQAFVTVDEEGTEAAAATAVVVGTTSAPEPVTLTVDRPFLFWIRDVPTGEVLFMGRVGDPSG